jgi:hypothetical protein
MKFGKIKNQTSFLIPPNNPVSPQESKNKNTPEFTSKLKKILITGINKIYYAAAPDEKHQLLANTAIGILMAQENNHSLAVSTQEGMIVITEHPNGGLQLNLNGSTKDFPDAKTLVDLKEKLRADLVSNPYYFNSHFEKCPIDEVLSLGCLAKNNPIYAQLAIEISKANVQDGGSIDIETSYGRLSITSQKSTSGSTIEVKIGDKKIWFPDEINTLARLKESVNSDISLHLDTYASYFSGAFDKIFSCGWKLEHTNAHAKLAFATLEAKVSNGTIKFDTPCGEMCITEHSDSKITITIGNYKIAPPDGVNSIASLKEKIRADFRENRAFYPAHAADDVQLLLAHGWPMENIFIDKEVGFYAYGRAALNLLLTPKTEHGVIEFEIHGSRKKITAQIIQTENHRIYIRCGDRTTEFSSKAFSDLKNQIRADMARNPHLYDFYFKDDLERFLVMGWDPKDLSAHDIYPSNIASIKPAPGQSSTTLIVTKNEKRTYLFAPLEASMSETNRIGSATDITGIDPQCPKYANRALLAYRISELLNFKLVPPTAFTIIDSIPGYVIEQAPEKAVLNSQQPQNRELVKLQIFDAIIGNTNRNSGNYHSDPETNKIYAMGNELCFGPLVTHLNQVDKMIQYSISLPAVIDTDIASAVKCLSSEQLRGLMADYGFNEEEIEAGLIRLKVVQDHVAMLASVT